jgi:DNA-binding Lrp family transcriptional regulator
VRRPLDKTDERILALLSADSRESYVEMAKKVGLSEAAVRRRITGLVEDGTIRRFTIELSEPQQTSAITYVSVSPSNPTSEVSKRIRGVRGVETIYETTGDFDIAAIIRGPNIAEVNRSVEEIRRVGGVLSTNTTMILRTLR